jgi:serine/threonine protein kinase
MPSHSIWTSRKGASSVTRSFHLQVLFNGTRILASEFVAGELRHIHTLKPWPLRRVLIEKYVYSPSEAEAMNSFLLPMLAINPRDRSRAADMLDHEWLDDI